MDSSTVRLKRMFNRFNDKYWAGQLPEVTVLWKPCDDALGKTVHFWDENGQLLDIQIWIDPKIEALDCFTRLTMLHEMGHLAVDPTGKLTRAHGRKWKAEMDRLWSIGAFMKEKCI